MDRFEVIKKVDEMYFNNGLEGSEVTYFGCPAIVLPQETLVKILAIEYYKNKKREEENTERLSRFLR